MGVKVRLTHYCNVPGCEGQPGAIVNVSPADADYLVGRGGAVWLNAGPSVGAKAVVPAPVETAMTGPAENAVTRTAPPDSAGKGKAAGKGK